jgi:hypothetical protein
MRTVAPAWAVRTRCAGCDSFTVCVFAIEIGFGIVVSEISPAFKRDSLFALRAWLAAAFGALADWAIACWSAFALRPWRMRRHFCALLTQDRLA